jgi:hypothetical protein
MDGNNHRTARMMDHFTLISKIAFADGVDRDFEDAAVKYFLTVQDLR